MAYVIMQKGLEAPRLDQLRTAFRGIPGLTPLDASIMCKDSLGILVKGLEQEQAMHLQAALTAQGVEAEAVDQGTLPALPPVRHITRVECTPDALLIYDPLGRSFPLEWKDIMVIAAGRVSVIEFKRKSTPAIQGDQTTALGVVDDLLFKGSGFSPARSRQVYREPDYHTEEEHHPRWMAELVIRGGGLRYNLEGETAGQPLFHYLGTRRTDDVAANFKLLVQDLCGNAPGATINRGAYYLREGNAAVFGYSCKNSFYDEMIWLLWQLSPQGQSGNEPG